MTIDETSAHFIPVAAFDVIVFGAAGDLSLRKLIPSLFHRWRDAQIPSNSKIVGVSRTVMSNEEYRALALDRSDNLRNGDSQFGRSVLQD